MQRSKPDSFEPPYPAYQSHFGADRTEFVMSLIGVQGSDVKADTLLIDEILSMLTLDASGKPLHVERGIQAQDKVGMQNDVLMSYWNNREDMNTFWQRDDVADWMARPMTGDTGWWRESFIAPVTSLDGNYSLPEAKYGIGRYVEQKVEQFHAYFGSMRDRVSDYLAGKADGTPGRLSFNNSVESHGKRLRISKPPAKLCFIRSPFGWKEATQEEQDGFVNDMLPVYKVGVSYLRDNPVEANCVSLRMLEEVEMGMENGLQMESLGWFLTLKDLERWTREHPTHLDIFQSVLKYMEKFNFEPKLSLGHEVVVVPESDAVFEYCNCHPKTGFLPFFEAHEV